MNVSTRRWLLAPMRQLRSRRLMAQHGPTLPYETAWILISLTRAPDEVSLARAWADENPVAQPGIDHDRWDELSPAEQIRRHRWRQRHGSSPVQILHLAVGLIESTGIRVVDWGAPLEQSDHGQSKSNSSD